MMDTASCTPPASSGGGSRVDTQNCSSTATQGRCSSRSQGSSSTAAPLWRTLFWGAQLGRRSEQAQAAIDKRMLLFWPWFVESAFQQHYQRTTLSVADAVCLPLDIFIWVLICLTSGGQTLCLACALPPLMVTLSTVLLRHQQPELYTRRRAALTALRRLGIAPALGLVLLRRPHHVTGSWAVAAVHLLVMSGSMHSLIAPFFFLNNWSTAMFEAVLTAAMLATAAPAACTNILAGPQPYAGWRVAAGEQHSTAQPDPPHPSKKHQPMAYARVVSVVAGSSHLTQKHKPKRRLSDITRCDVDSSSPQTTKVAHSPSSPTHKIPPSPFPAGLMDKAALNLYSSSLQDPALEHAVCTTTLNTLLVSARAGSHTPAVLAVSCACVGWSHIHTEMGTEGYPHGFRHTLCLHVCLYFT